jgi:DNA (cytosine-5)-methyltransferase 1
LLFGGGMDVAQEIVVSAFDNLGIAPAEFSYLLAIKDDPHGAKVSSWLSGDSRPTAAMLRRIRQIGAVPPPFLNRRKKSSFKFIDLFAGVGGFRLAFQNAGGKCEFSSEIDRYAQTTYTANFGEIPSGDITKIQSTDIPDHDILLGGFPCQAFSQAGLKKGFADTRGTLFFEIQRILVEKQPVAFVLENVKRLRTHDSGNTLRTILGVLRGDSNIKVPKGLELSNETKAALSAKLNYHVDFRILRAADFGVPQNRERIFIVGINKDKFRSGLEGLVETSFFFPEPPKTPTRLGDILEPNIDIPKRYTISPRMWSGHKTRKIRNKAKGKGFGYSLVNHDSCYSSTISARYWKDGSEVLIDQVDIGSTRPRTLTPREAARLQGFPDEFRIDAVSEKELYKQMGNAVALPVVEVVRDHLLNALFDLQALPGLSKAPRLHGKRPPQQLLPLVS